MLQSLVTQLGAVAVVCICLYALIAGSWRERFGGLIYLTAYLLSLGFGVISTRTPDAIWYLLVADIVCLLGFYMMCWKSRHPWPQWALGGQLVSVSIGIATIANLGIARWSYLTLQTAAGWGVLLALLLGTINAAQTRRNAHKSPAPQNPPRK